VPVRVHIPTRLHADPGSPASTTPPRSATRWPARRIRRSQHGPDRRRRDDIRGEEFGPERFDAESGTCLVDSYEGETAPVSVVGSDAKPVTIADHVAVVKLVSQIEDPEAIAKLEALSRHASAAPPACRDLPGTGRLGREMGSGPHHGRAETGRLWLPIPQFHPTGPDWSKEQSDVQEDGRYSTTGTGDRRNQSHPDARPADDERLPSALEATLERTVQRQITRSAIGTAPNAL
jgi:hypothetical protein